MVERWVARTCTNKAYYSSDCDNSLLCELRQTRWSDNKMTSMIIPRAHIFRQRTWITIFSKTAGFEKQAKFYFFPGCSSETQKEYRSHYWCNFTKKPRKLLKAVRFTMDWCPVCSATGERAFPHSNKWLITVPHKPYALIVSCTPDSEILLEVQAFTI